MPTPSSNTNASQKILAGASILAILASACWIVYRAEFAAPVVNRPLQRAVGEVLAEQTVRAIGHTGKVVVVTVKSPSAPELKFQLQAFQKRLKDLGSVAVEATLVLDSREDPKFRPGAGLSAKRFLKIVRKHPRVDAIVSFVGAPRLTEDELAKVKSGPKLIAEARSPERLNGLLAQKTLAVAVVPRFEFPAPGPRKPITDRQWFDRYFQVVATDTQLPAESTAP